MTLRRTAVSLSAVVLLALAGCGGGGDDDSADTTSDSSSASQSADMSESASSDVEESESSDDGGGGGGSGADEFCGVFEDMQAKSADFTGQPTDETIDEIRQFADDIENTAPDEIADDAAKVSEYLHLLADAAGGDTSNAGDLSEATNEFASAMASVGVWAATNCT